MVIKNEIRFVEIAFARTCARIDVMIDNDLSVNRMDVAQRKWDMKQMLLEDVYQPWKDEYVKLLALINKYRDPDNPPKLSRKDKSTLHHYLLEFYMECKKNEWKDTDWKIWNTKFEQFIAQGMNREINQPEEE